MTMKTTKLFLCACAAVLMTACGGGKQTVNSNPIAENAPAWVNQSGAAFKDGSFYGVGMAQGIKNRALAVDAADGRARAKIAEALDTYVSKLTKDYMASTTAGDMADPTPGCRWKWYRGSASVSLEDASSGKVFVSFNASAKEADSSAPAALLGTEKSLGKKIGDGINAGIQSYSDGK